MSIYLTDVLWPHIVQTQDMKFLFLWGSQHFQRYQIRQIKL